MSAHHGPPCGHTVLGTCPGCGAQPRAYTVTTPVGPIKFTADPTFDPGEFRIAAAEQEFALTNQTRTFAPVTVTAEARFPRAQLRAKVAASAAADRARAPSVVVDLEDW